MDEIAVLPSEGGRLSFTVAAVSLERGMVKEPSWSARPLQSMEKTGLVPNACVSLIRTVSSKTLDAPAEWKGSNPEIRSSKKFCRELGYVATVQHIAPHTF